MSLLLPETFLTPIRRKIQHVLTMMRLDMTREVNAACNFNCLIETEGFPKITGSHVHRKSNNIWETVQNKDVATTNH